MACATRTEVRHDSRPGIAPGRCAAGRGGGDDGADKRARGRSETGTGALRGLRRQAPTGGVQASVREGDAGRPLRACWAGRVRVRERGERLLRKAGRGRLAGCSWASALARASALGRGEGRGCWARGERLGRLGLGSGKRGGGSDGPDWVGFWVLLFLILSHFYF